LSKYCYSLLDTEQNRTIQFIKKLRPEFPSSNYSTAVDAATRTENEDKIRFVSKVAYPAKKFPTKRSFGQQWNNRGK
jgi:hypothetical protein